jgi:hypothetical protein
LQINVFVQPEIAEGARRSARSIGRCDEGLFSMPVKPSLFVKPQRA